MLWKDSNIHLRNCKVLAVQRLESLEKILIKNPNKVKQYSDTMKKYVELGHATKLSTTESTPTSNVIFYIPHHYVTSLNKENIFRVIFDALAKFARASLNDYFLKGPDLLNSLVTVLLRFRNRKYSISADIEKIFHHIFLNKMRETI